MVSVRLHHALLERALLPRTRVTGRFESSTSSKPKNNAQNAWESGPVAPTDAAGGPHICRSVHARRARIGHYACVAGRAIRGATCVLIALAACGSTGHSESASGVAPSVAVETFCDTYGVKIHRQAVNVRGTTAGAVAQRLRLAHEPASPWASRPATHVVALCTYPPPQGASPSEPTTVCPGGAIVGIEQNVLTFYVGTDAVTSVPSQLVDSPCVGVR